MKLTIIGAGNMGGATARGLVRAGRLAASDITVADLNQDILSRFAAAGYNTSNDNAQAVKGADIVILAVKPFLAEQVVKGFRDSLEPDQILISFAAGVTGDTLKSWLDNGKGGLKCGALFLTIPNIAIELCQGMTFICPVVAAQADTDKALGLFEGTGTSLIVNEKNLASGMALSSCGIAFAMRYIRAAAEGGVELGFYPNQAVQIVCQTVQGAASLIMEHGSNPEVEIDKVTTPGGFTIRGLNAMEAAGFTAAVQSGIRAGK